MVPADVPDESKPDDDKDEEDFSPDSDEDAAPIVLEDDRDGPAPKRKATKKMPVPGLDSLNIVETAAAGQSGMFYQAREVDCMAIQKGVPMGNQINAVPTLV